MLGTWQNMTLLPTPMGGRGRSLHQTFIYQGRLYAVGGWYGDGQPAYADAYYAPIQGGGTLGSFVQTTSLPEGVVAHSTTVSPDGKIYLVHNTNSYVASASLFVAQIAADGSIGTWVQQPNIDGLMANNAGNTAIALVSNLLVVVGYTNTFVLRLDSSGYLDSLAAVIDNPAYLYERSVYAVNGRPYVTATTGKIYRIDGLDVTNPLGERNLVLSLNNTGDLMTIPSSTDLQNPTEITVEAWIYPSPPGAHGWFMLKGDGLTVSSQQTYQMDWVTQGGNTGIGTGVEFSFFLGTTDWALLGAPLLHSNWTHVAATFQSQSGIFALYTNGQQAASTTIAADKTTSLIGKQLRQTSLPLIIGGGPTAWAKGYVDEIRIWNKARSAQDIYGNIFCRLTGTETNLAGYWNFDAGTAIDLTGHGHNGTFAGNAQAVPTQGTDAVHAGVCGAVLPARAATAQAVVMNGFLIDASVTDGGYSYTNKPTVRIFGGGGSGAQAQAVVSNGVVTAVRILSAGSGYTSQPVIVIAPPFIEQPVMGIAAMSLLSFNNLVVGTNYQLQAFKAGTWSNIGVAFPASNSTFMQYVSGTAATRDYRLAFPPVPSQAYATVQMVNGFVVGATVTSGGSGYTSAPAVTIKGGGGTNATAIAQVSSGVVTSFTITSAGIGYTNTPAITIAPPPAKVVWPIVAQVMKLDFVRLAPYDDYQVEFSPVPVGAWSNLGVPFTPTSDTNTQYLSVTGEAGFFRAKHLP
jgi:hypothetical protein